MKTQKTTQHTPGPWAINRAGYLEMAGETCECSAADVSTLRAPYAEANANLRLVAAAPDLLAALEKAMRLYGVDMQPAHRDEFRAAIAKATRAPEPAAAPELEAA